MYVDMNVCVYRRWTCRVCVFIYICVMTDCVLVNVCGGEVGQMEGRREGGVKEGRKERGKDKELIRKERLEGGK